jgi:hypothetical protein
MATNAQARPEHRVSAVATAKVPRAEVTAAVQRSVGPGGHAHGAVRWAGEGGAASTRTHPRIPPGAPAQVPWRRGRTCWSWMSASARAAASWHCLAADGVLLYICPYAWRTM